MLDLASLAPRNAFYSVYNVGDDGKPIIPTVTDIPIEESTTTSNKAIITVPYNGKLYKFIDNKYYTFEGEEIKDSTLIETLDINRIIDTNSLLPVYSSKGDTYYIIDEDLNNPIVVKRTGSRNIVKANKEAALKLIAKYKAEQEAKIKAENAKKELEELESQLTELSEVIDLEEEGADVASQLTGNFSEKKPEVKQSVTPVEVKPVQQSKKDINKVGGKSLENLHNSNNLTTFVDIYNNMQYKMALKNIFKAKKWDWSTNVTKVEEILRSKNIPLIGITNVENWLTIIKNCR